MTWLLATMLLAAAAPFVLWPLLTHWEPEAEPEATTSLPAADLRDDELEE